MFEVVDDPVVCCCVFDDVWELLDADDDWEVVDVDDDAPVFVLTVDDNITQVAVSDTTYPVEHLTHLKSLVNY